MGCVVCYMGMKNLIQCELEVVVEDGVSVEDKALELDYGFPNSISDGVYWEGTVTGCDVDRGVIFVECGLDTSSVSVGDVRSSIMDSFDQIEEIVDVT